MAQESEVEPDLSHIHWSMPEWIAANPAKSLSTADLAMDYFAFSPFFDTKSNNNVLSTQRKIEHPDYGHAQAKFELNAFRSGFEYIVAHAQPPELFVIHRRDVRPDGSRESIAAAYFILHDRVYPTPTLYGVMSARLRNASYLVSQTFNTLSSAHPPANPRAPSQWRGLPPSATADPSSSTHPAVAVAGHQVAEDVDMAESSTPAAAIVSAAEAPKAKSGTPARAPDFHLFNALQATRAALSDLDRLAAEPPTRVDPVDELRAIEASIMGRPKGAGGKGQGQAKTVRAVSSSGAGAGGTPSAAGRIASSPVASTATAGIPVRAGKAQSIVTSGVGQSPLATFNTVAG